MSRWARRVDSNHGEIAAAATAIGAMVVDLSRAGDGIPDLLIGWRGLWLLVEVKDGRKPPSARALTPDQVEFHADAEFRGLPCYIVESVDRLLEILGGVK